MSIRCNLRSKGVNMPNANKNHKTLLPAKDKFRDGPWLPHEKDHLLERLERMMRFSGILSPKAKKAYQVLLDIMDYMDEVGMKNASAFYADGGLAVYWVC